VGNYKEAVYNVFDKMEDALQYIHPPSKTLTSTRNTTNSNNAGNQNRKRAAVLPCSSTSVNTKKPRTVSIVVQSTMPAPRKVSLSTGEVDKENMGPVGTTQTTKGSIHATAVKPEVEESDDGPVEDGRPLPNILEEGYKNAYVKGWRANALFPQKKQCR
jgi:hypothetical protein